MDNHFIFKREKGSRLLAVVCRTLPSVFKVRNVLKNNVSVVPMNGLCIHFVTLRTHFIQWPVYIIYIYIIQTFHNI